MDTPRVLLNLWRLGQVFTFFLLNKVVSEPYMDEIFHVPQAQAYCLNEFAYYDPKLTTPPGLYIISFLLHQVGLPCSLTYLRYVNLFVGTILLPDLFSKLWQDFHPTCSDRELRWAKCIAMMPLLSFFSNLYYTDLPSIYIVLLSYHYSLNDKLFPAALVRPSSPLSTPLTISSQVSSVFGFVKLI